MSWKLAPTLALLVLLTTGPLNAQSEIEIPDEVTCPDCEILLKPITTIGRFEDDVALRLDSQFAIDHERERIYAGQTYLPGTIVMYDFDGNLLGTFGRSGEGPGEFGSSAIGFKMEVDDEGNLHVVDSGRRTIVLPELEGLVRTHQIRYRFDDVTSLDDGRLLGANTALRVVIEDEFRFVLLDSLGNELDRIVPMPDNPAPVMLPEARDGYFWAAYMEEYRIDRYSLSGDPQQVIRRSPEWFRPPAPNESSSPFSRPTFGNVFEDAEGRLWSVILVPAADRERAEEVLAGVLRLDELDRGDVQDTMIEVLDPAKGAVLARLRLPEAMMHVRDDVLVHKTHGPEGLVQAAFFQLSLTEREERR